MEGVKTKIKAVVKAAKTALWDSSSEEEEEEEEEDKNKKVKKEQQQQETQQKTQDEGKKGLKEETTSKKDDDTDNGWITKDDVVMAAEITADVMTLGIYGTVAECVDAVENYRDRVKAKNEIKNKNDADPQAAMADVPGEAGIPSEKGNSSQPKKENNDDDSDEFIGEDEEELATDIVGNVLTLGIYGGIKGGIEAFDEWREERKQGKALANSSSETAKKMAPSEGSS